MGQADVVAIVERIYDLHEPPDRWLSGVVDAAVRVLDLGEGLQGYFVALGPTGAEASGFARSHGRDVAEIEARFALWRSRVPADYQRTIHRMVACGLASRITADTLAPPVEEVMPPMGLSDAFGVNGLDARGTGVALVAFSPGRVPAGSEPDTQVWSRIAAHLATGCRLIQRRWSNGAPIELGAEAVFDDAGRPQHLEGPARYPMSQETLRRFAVDVDRARTRATRVDPEEATRLWRALAGGRWSIVERFDTDGRRFVVACPNEVPVGEHTPLSRREEQAVGYASLGHSDKLIAYEMGLSRGTVAQFLARARKKLGVATRAELIALWLTRRDGTS